MLRISLAGLLAIGAILAVVFLTGRSGSQVNANSQGTAAEGEGGTSEVSVKTVHAKNDPSFTISTEQPAYVRAYYRADLESRVEGPVKFVQATIGTPVKKGEALIEIDAPDLVEDIHAKEKTVEQRKRDRDLAAENVKKAEAALDLAKNNVKLKKTEVDSAEATRDFRSMSLTRVEGLTRQSAVQESLLDEAKLNYRSAEVAKHAAEVGVEKARLGIKDAEAELAAAKADVKLKESLIEVAAADLAKARATLELATIRAPFDGIVVRRDVDPGSFVEKGSSGHSEPLMTVARTDIVTVYIRLPDTYAPYITANTEAVIEMTELPGQKIYGKVTRYNPSLQNQEKDRTMIVEVDLWNRSESEYNKFKVDEEKIKAADLKAGPLPLFPRLKSQDPNASCHLIPGMYGSMKLVLQKFHDAYLVPSETLVSQGGKPYIYVVKDGKAHLQAVEVQVNDGEKAKIVLLGKNGVKRSLTGKEEIVATNQGELSDGTPVKTTPDEEWDKGHHTEKAE